MIRAYHQPKGIDEALSLLKNGAQAVAGATGLYSNRKRLDGELVDITGLHLDGIEVKGGAIHLGACVTLTKLLEADLPGAEGAFLKLVARHITAHTMRNAITLGGNDVLARGIVSLEGVANGTKRFDFQMPVRYMTAGTEIRFAIGNNAGGSGTAHANDATGVKVFVV